MPESRDFTIPGDISSAAFWLVAAAAQPGGHLLVRDIGLNDTRTALLGVLVRMGAQVREAVEDVDQLEPRGIVEITGAPLKGTVIQGKEVPQLIDELPVLAVAGALASGTTIIRHAQELRVKETDRIAAIAHNLRIMGAQVIEMNDGLEIHGPAPLRGARVASFGDHRIAMAFAVAGMFADGETIIQDADCVRESYPGFETALDEFTDPKRMRASTPVIGSISPARLDEGNDVRALRCAKRNGTNVVRRSTRSTSCHRHRWPGRFGQKQRGARTGAAAQFCLRQLRRDVSRRHLVCAGTRR